MSDDLNKRIPQDASRISLTETWEINYWTHKFNVTESVLRQAINAVGNGARNVEGYLKTKGYLK